MSSSLLFPLRFKVGQRISKCLRELTWESGGGEGAGTNYTAVKNAAQLAKCLKSTVWENSAYVSKQFERVGVAYSTSLVHAGLTDFPAIARTDPRQLELILNRPPPFGNHVRDAARQMPIYRLQVEKGECE